MYVIQCADHGRYVQPAGSRKSYGALETARIFGSREAAERERCTGNERVRAVADILRSGGRR